MDYLGDFRAWLFKNGMMGDATGVRSQRRLGGAQGIFGTRIGGRVWQESAGQRPDGSADRRPTTVPCEAREATIASGSSAFSGRRPTVERQRTPATS